MPLAERSLSLLGTDDARRRMVGAISDWDDVATPSPAFSPLAGSPPAATSLHYSPNEIPQVSNFYHNQVLAPTRNHQVLTQNDTGLAVAAVAESRHSAVMNERNEK